MVCVRCVFLNQLSHGFDNFRCLQMMTHLYIPTEISCKMTCDISLRWRHNGHDGVPNHEPRYCLLNRLFGPRSKKTSKLRVAGFVRGIHRGPGTSPHKWPVTRKMFPFDDVIMSWNFSIVPTIPLLLVLTAATPNAPAIMNWKITITSSSVL